MKLFICSVAYSALRVLMEHDSSTLYDFVVKMLVAIYEWNYLYTTKRLF